MNKKNYKGLTVEQIEKILGFDKVKPIQLTESDAEDMMEKENYFEEWYREELLKFAKEACERNDGALEKMDDGMTIVKCFDCQQEFETNNMDDMMCPDCEHEYLEVEGEKTNE